MKNRGTVEGKEEEISLVKKINSNREKYNTVFNLPNINYLAIHVTHKVFGEIQQKKVFPKADIYLISVKNPLLNQLMQDNYLSEDQILKFREGLDYTKIMNSGISVKMSDSHKYQITKINPSTFQKIFKTKILGAGASIYCKNLDELKKNVKVLDGWSVKLDEFLAYFQDRLGRPISPNNLEDLSIIKRYSNAAIKEKIQNDQNIKNYIFKGIGNFAEPYTSQWLYANAILEKLDDHVDFTVTTGSGRTKGNFTIVIKPTSHP